MGSNCTCLISCCLGSNVDSPPSDTAAFDFAILSC